MALTYAFKQSMKWRTRRSRRIEVAMFGMFLAIGLSEGGRNLGWNNLGLRALPFIIVIGRVYKWWHWQRMVTVSSLDDRAMLEHGVAFEALGEAERKDLLRRYRVGTYIMGYYPDEREETAERESKVQAYAVLRWLLPTLAIIDWAGWLWLPPGAVRAAWTNGPTVMAWMFLLVLALPQVLRMWTEPDEVGEPRVVAGVEA
jgi:hypothetical protein